MGTEAGSGLVFEPLARVVGADGLRELEQTVHVLLAAAHAAAVRVAVEAHDVDVARAVGDRSTTHLVRVRGQGEARVRQG